MPQYLQIVVNLPSVSGVFDYHLPEAVKNVQIGSLVLVPFGNQIVQGIVTRFVDHPQVVQTKAVIGLVDPQPVLTEQQFNLAHWMSENTFSPLTSCFQIMIPPGMTQQADRLYSVIAVPEEYPLSPLQRLLVIHLQEKGPKRGRQLEKAFPRRSWRESLKRLETKGIIRVEAYLPPPKVQPKKVKMVQLACAPEEIEGKLLNIGRQGKAAERRSQIMMLVEREPWGLSTTVIYAMTGSTLTDIKKLAEHNLVQLSETEIFRDPLASYDWIDERLPHLTASQSAVWASVQTEMHKPGTNKPMLLHGVTGSGKTEIYLRMVEKVLGEGGQAIVLVPEISLTPQTVKRFHTRFPGKVGIIHSKLSMGERYDTWRRARDGELSVIVGPRSALFSPLKKLKLIILDECHDDSYSQADLKPHYNAVQTAEAYARIAGALLMYGSATPNVEMVYRAKREDWLYLSMPNRIMAHAKTVDGKYQAGQTMEAEGEVRYMPLPKVSVVDMRTELKANNRSIFSRELRTSITENLNKGHQTILFLNRRGTATYVFCRDCGHRLVCPHCDIPLTFHKDQDHLVCHLCNYKRSVPKTCPECGSAKVRQFGTGTEKVEQEVIKAFPQARVLRLDSGMTNQKGAHEIILKQVADRQADILVGTQMLAKGIDLPYVTLVGVILADVGLNLPDFRASERTFQLLTQVAGRAGRSPLGGRVIFQTYQPEEYAIRFAAKHDFDQFYTHEIAIRKKMIYPPFANLIRLEFRSEKYAVAKQNAEMTAARIKHWIHNKGAKQTSMIGPVPCFYQRVSGIYRWQLVLRGPNPLHVIAGEDLGETVVTVDPVSLL